MNEAVTEKKVEALVGSKASHATKQLMAWRNDFAGFVKWLFPELALTGQQAEGMEAISRLIGGKWRLSRGEELGEEEAEYAGKLGVSIMSGHNTGKDLLASVVILAFTLLFPYSKNIATANTAKQLRNVLWSEIHKCRRQYSRRLNEEQSLLENELVLQAEKLYVKYAGAEEWFTEAVTVNTSLSEEEQAEAISGRHADYQIAVIDEASGLADAVFRKLERTLSGKVSFMLIIFNPTRSKGYAIESQKDPRFISLRWNAEESRLPSKTWLENMRKRYDPEDNSYRVGVLGLPPKMDENVLFPWDKIEDALTREIEIPDDTPIIKGVDVGGGQDKSVIATRKGYRVYPFKHSNSPDSAVVANWAGSDIDAERPTKVYVDVIGLGWAIAGGLKDKKGSIIQNADSRSTSIRPEKFFNKRAEIYYRLRDAFINNLISLSMLNDDQKREIKFQLGAIKSEMDAKGRFKIVEKARIKKQIGHSPDECDSLALTFYEDEELLSRIWERKGPTYLEPVHTCGWMGH